MITLSSASRVSLAALALCAGLAGTAAAQGGGGPGGVRYAPGDASSEQPMLLRDVGFDQRLDAQVPGDLLFRDETGATVRLGDYFGKRPIILALVYYECPMLCSQTLNGVVSALDILKFDAGREFDVLAVSFNPKEGPGLASARKRAYTERYNRPGTEGGWHFLTGPPESIAQLTAAVGFRYAWDDKIKQFAHAAGLVVLTPEGRVSKYHYGFEYSPRDLRFAVIQASEEKIGTVADQFLLYCYHYDPTSGKYGMATMTLVRVSGVATILSMVTFWVVMWRREKHEARAGGTAGNA
jgi:protein SCO1